MWKYFLIALAILVVLSLIKVKGKRIVDFRRFLFMLALFPLILLIVLFSSVIIIVVLACFILVVVIGYAYFMFSRKRRFRKVVVIK